MNSPAPKTSVGTWLLRIFLGSFLIAVAAPVAGVLPAAIGANSRDEGLICPAACGAEAAWASPDIQIVAANSLIQIANHIKGTQVLSRPQPKVHERGEALLDLRDARVQSIQPS